jgi:hypothetical protein
LKPLVLRVFCVLEITPRRYGFSTKALKFGYFWGNLAGLLG